ncbi:hypothetical protein CHS0354_037691 [Potamilus streckersoni]|uniref:Uncharacterized protein n=1 Tax=Potamilus streckersoni TaxID=2493646 RepID=A0AAE0T0I1_9BIVA|nr:hypothetical protein CHS0354_037691 [Potamilus streckersoni]
MCRLTKRHSSAKYNCFCRRHQPDILGCSKQIKTSLIPDIKCWLCYMPVIFHRAYCLHYIKKVKTEKEANEKDAKQLNHSTNIFHAERLRDRRDNIIVSDVKERIIVRDVPEVFHTLNTGVHENSDILFARNDLDKRLFLDVSSLNIAPSLSMANLHDCTDNAIGNFEEQDFSGVISDLDRNDGANLQEVKSTNISWETSNSTAFDNILDLRDFEQDDLERIITVNSASIDNADLQEVRDLKCSHGCIQLSEETDDPVISNIHLDETRHGLNYFLKRFDNTDNYSGDECRGEIKDEGKISETKLDSGLGDSIKTISIDCSLTSVSNESEGNCASGILLENACTKDENLSYDGTHIVPTPEGKIATLFNIQNLHLWSYTNVTLYRNLRKKKKWMLCRRRKQDSSLGYESSHSFEQSISDESSHHLCEFLLQVRCAGDSYGNTSNCNKCNHVLSVSSAKVFDIPLIEESEKAVPIILFPWLIGSEIRFICPVEYIVMPASLKNYFNKVTKGTLTREEMMAYEWIRYASFHSFPRSIDMSSTRLANAGFYSTGSGTQARCFCCKVTHDRWSRGDDPYEVHRRISPNCPFLRVEAHCPQNIPIYQQDDQNTSRVNENSCHPMQAQHTPSIERINPASAQASSALARDSAVQNEQESFKKSGLIPKSSTRTETKETSDSNHFAIQPNTAGRQYSYNNQSMQNDALLAAHIDDNRITQISRPEARGLPVSTLEGAPLSIAQQPTDDAHNTEYSNPENFSFRPHQDSRVGNVPGNQSTSPSRGPLRTTERPKHLDYQIMEQRIKSFTGWPLRLDQTPQQMAEAGFFYVGVQDYVRCFQCGGGLRNFEPGDNPWIEHTRWYPQCAYVRGKKGQRFVDAVAKKQQELLAQQGSQNVIDTFPSNSASLNQSASTGSRPSRDSASLKEDSPGKQASLNKNANQIIAALSGHSKQNVDARLFGPASLAYLVPGNTPEHLNRRARENDSQQEAFNVPETSSMPPFDPKSILEENARLRNSSRCKVCQQREAVIAFLPCGHLATCESCAPTQTVCCVCHKKILASIRTCKIAEPQA